MSLPFLENDMAEPTTKIITVGQQQFIKMFPPPVCAGGGSDPHTPLDYFLDGYSGNPQEITYHCRMCGRTMKVKPLFTETLPPPGWKPEIPLQ
jgi:hypothetical protein